MWATVQNLSSGALTVTLSDGGAYVVPQGATVTLQDSDGFYFASLGPYTSSGTYSFGTLATDATVPIVHFDKPVDNGAFYAGFALALGFMAWAFYRKIIGAVVGEGGDL